MGVKKQKSFMFSPVLGISMAVGENRMVIKKKRQQQKTKLMLISNNSN